MSLSATRGNRTQGDIYAINESMIHGGIEVEGGSIRHTRDIFSVFSAPSKVIQNSALWTPPVDYDEAYEAAEAQAERMDRDAEDARLVAEEERLRVQAWFNTVNAKTPRKSKPRVASSDQVVMVPSGVNKRAVLKTLGQEAARLGYRTLIKEARDGTSRRTSCFELTRDVTGETLKKLTALGAVVKIKSNTARPNRARQREQAALRNVAA